MNRHSGCKRPPVVVPGLFTLFAVSNMTLDKTNSSVVSAGSEGKSTNNRNVGFTMWLLLMSRIRSTKKTNAVTGRQVPHISQYYEQFMSPDVSSHIQILESKPSNGVNNKDIVNLWCNPPANSPWQPERKLTLQIWGRRRLFRTWPAGGLDWIMPQTPHDSGCLFPSAWSKTLVRPRIQQRWHNN